MSIPIGDGSKALALEPVRDEDVPPHNSTFINELKISDFKQVLLRNNIPAEFSNGALWCANSTIAIRRVNKFKMFNMFHEKTKFISFHRWTLVNC